MNLGFQCDELAIALLRIENSPSFFFNPKSWQTSQFQCKQRIPPQKILPTILPKDTPTKSSQTIPQINPKKFQKILKKFLRFWKYPIPYIGLVQFKTCAWIVFYSRGMKFTLGCGVWQFCYVDHRGRCSRVAVYYNEMVFSSWYILTFSSVHE